MERRNLIIIGVAVVFGLFAVILANAYFSGVEQRQQVITEDTSMSRIAVASLDMPFGTPITAENVRLVAWPSSSIPAGAYKDAAAQQLIGSGNVTIRPIAAGEPVLLSRISDRAVLSANIPPNMRAVTVSIDPVSGVAGFVTPGDVVDVLLTRQIAGDGADSNDQMATVVLESVPVLAIDTRVSEQDTAAAPESKTATLQVFPEGAQKLALASQIGRLSLSLRNVEDQSSAGQRVVTTRDRSLSGGLYMAERRTAQAAPAPAPAPARTEPAPRMAAVDRTSRDVAPRRPTGPTMAITRGTEQTIEEVRRDVR